MPLAFGSGESWWGALAELPAPWTLVLCVMGVLLVERLNKLPLLLTFLLVYFGAFTAISFSQPQLVAEMFRPPFLQAALFLAFFMLTDPPTSPGKASDQVWMGALAGFVAAGAQLAGLGQAYLLVGLLAVNVALTVQRLGQGRRRAAPGPGVPPFRTDRVNGNVTLAA